MPPWHDTILYHTTIDRGTPGAGKRRTSPSNGYTNHSFRSPKKEEVCSKIGFEIRCSQDAIKILAFWLQETVGKKSIIYIRVKILEEAYIKHYMHVRYLEPETILSIIWTLFLDARCFFGTSISKAQLQDPTGIRPDSPSILGVVQSMKAGFIGRRDDIPWEWRKEYIVREKGGPNQTNQGTLTGYSSQTGNNGGCQRGGTQELRGRLHPRIQ